MEESLISGQRVLQRWCCAGQYLCEGRQAQAHKLSFCCPTNNVQERFASCGRQPSWRVNQDFYNTAQEGSLSRGGTPDKCPTCRSRRRGTFRCLICVTYPRKMMDNGTTQRYGAHPLGRKNAGPSASKGPTPNDQRSLHPTLNSQEAGSGGKTYWPKTTNNSSKKCQHRTEECRRYT